MAEAPRALGWFRAWCGLMVAIYLGFVVAGGALALHCLQEPALGPGAAALLGGSPAIAGLIGAGGHAAGLVLPRRPWAWTLGLVLLILGALSTCPPLAVPLLVFWLRPDLKAWFAGEP